MYDLTRAAGRRLRDLSRVCAGQRLAGELINTPRQEWNRSLSSGRDAELCRMVVAPETAQESMRDVVQGVVRPESSRHRWPTARLPAPGPAAWPRYPPMVAEERAAGLSSGTRGATDRRRPDTDPPRVRHTPVARVGSHAHARITRPQPSDPGQTPVLASSVAPSHRVGGRF